VLSLIGTLLSGIHCGLSERIHGAGVFSGHQAVDSSTKVPNDFLAVD
jgi:hypothetical protein